ncbi:unnamed protein product [Arctogadus glacialis]
MQQHFLLESPARAAARGAQPPERVGDAVPVPGSQMDRRRRHGSGRRECCCDDLSCLQPARHKTLCWGVL